MLIGSGATTYVVRGFTSATLADVVVGSKIDAQGTWNSDGSLAATSVEVHGLRRAKAPKGVTAPKGPKAAEPTKSEDPADS